MKIKTSLFTIILIVFAFGKSIAQEIYVYVNVNMPYGLMAKNYIQQGNSVKITIVNTALVPKAFKIFTSLESTSNRISIAYTSAYKMSAASIHLAPTETRIFTLNQLQAMNGIPSNRDIYIRGYDSKKYFNNGNLPGGLYKLCVTIEPVNSNGNLLAVGCANFFINSYDPPIILNPKNSTTVNHLQPQNILFNWTPSGVVGKTKYKFKLIDLNITPVNNPNDAFKKNVVPFFQQLDIATTSLVYDNTKPNLIDDHTYALEITAYDPHNNYLYKNDGRSQVSVFTYKKNVNGGMEYKQEQRSDSVNVNQLDKN